uniref:Uncharacterized protein n=1 Tax=Populus trichocarpa TaxID=3694 RepID=A0A3N7FR31_POPTR|eukprot:XP_024436987.1 protein TORNADO 1 [Populus trichocarpa]
MESGFVSRKEVEKILRGSLQSQIPGMGSKVFESFEASDLVMKMLKLELCYEQNPSDPYSLLLIPSILQEGRGKPQRWQLSTTDCNYAGRHLECEDSSHTFLAPGFFPLLQVHLHNRIMALKNQHGATCSLHCSQHLQNGCMIINTLGIQFQTLEDLFQELDLI